MSSSRTPPSRSTTPLSTNQQREEIQRRLHQLRQGREQTSANSSHVELDALSGESHSAGGTPASNSGQSGAQSHVMNGVTVSVGDRITVTDDQRALQQSDAVLGNLTDRTKIIYLGETGKVVSILSDYYGKDGVELKFVDDVTKFFFAECLQIGDARTPTSVQSNSRRGTPMSTRSATTPTAADMKRKGSSEAGPQSTTAVAKEEQQNSSRMSPTDESTVPIVAPPALPPKWPEFKPGGQGRCSPSSQLGSSFGERPPLAPNPKVTPPPSKSSLLVNPTTTTTPRTDDESHAPLDDEDKPATSRHETPEPPSLANTTLPRSHSSTAVVHTPSVSSTDESEEDLYHYRGSAFVGGATASSATTTTATATTIASPERMSREEEVLPLTENSSLKTTMSEIPRVDSVVKTPPSSQQGSPNRGGRGSTYHLTRTSSALDPSTWLVTTKELPLSLPTCPPNYIPRHDFPSSGSRIPRAFPSLASPGKQLYHSSSMGSGVGISKKSPARQGSLSRSPVRQESQRATDSNRSTSQPRTGAVGGTLASRSPMTRSSLPTKPVGPIKLRRCMLHTKEDFGDDAQAKTIVIRESHTSFPAILSLCTRELGWGTKGCRVERLFDGKTGHEIADVKDITDAMTLVATTGDSFVATATAAASNRFDPSGCRVSPSTSSRPAAVSPIRRSLSREQDSQSPSTKTAQRGVSPLARILAQCAPRTKSPMFRSGAGTAVPLGSENALGQTPTGEKKRSGSTTAATGVSPLRRAAAPVPSPTRRGSATGTGTQAAGQTGFVGGPGGMLKPVSVRVYVNGEYGDIRTDPVPFRTVTVRPTHKSMMSVYSMLGRELAWSSIGRKVESIYTPDGTEIKQVSGLAEGSSVIVSAGDKFVAPKPQSVLYETGQGRTRTPELDNPPTRTDRGFRLVESKPSADSAPKPKPKPTTVKPAGTSSATRVVKSPVRRSPVRTSSAGRLATRLDGCDSVAAMGELNGLVRSVLRSLFHPDPASRGTPRSVLRMPLFAALGFQPVNASGFQVSEGLDEAIQQTAEQLSRALLRKEGGPDYVAVPDYGLLMKEKLNQDQLDVIRTLNEECSGRILAQGLAATSPTRAQQQVEQGAKSPSVHRTPQRADHSIGSHQQLVSPSPRSPREMASRCGGRQKDQSEGTQIVAAAPSVVGTMVFTLQDLQTVSCPLPFLPETPYTELSIDLSSAGQRMAEQSHFVRIDMLALTSSSSTDKDEPPTARPPETGYSVRASITVDTARGPSTAVSEVVVPLEDCLTPTSAGSRNEEPSASLMLAVPHLRRPGSRAESTSASLPSSEQRQRQQLTVVLTVEAC